MYEEIIEKCSLFQGVSAHFKEHFLAKYEVKHFANNKRVVEQGDDSDGMYIVLKGELQVVVTETNKTESDNVIAKLGPTHYFGEISMISESKRTANVDTKTYADLMFIKRDDFQQSITSRDPDALMVAYNIANLLVDRLKETNQLVATLTAETPQSSELSAIRKKLLSIEIL